MYSGKKMTPEQDSQFQKIMSMFISAAAGPKERLVREKGYRPASMTGDLFELRLQFEVTHLLWVCYTDEDRRAAYRAYREVRNSPKGHVYIKANPDYFTETHHALCRVAVDVKESHA